ncbi:hypothetical protein CEY15_11910 [Dietzia natronolimnaea]|uniref:Uncharacterized protein n=1 Tax=Dietzia natronolimnaea TaxID=161920 RepID=A0A2A2WP26_9ACTN|nr:hypothetical protein CEY15_11910 [Dietzia natronolimnaea]
MAACAGAAASGTVTATAESRASAERAHLPVVVDLVDLVVGRLCPMAVPLSDGARRGSAGASA